MPRTFTPEDLALAKAKTHQAALARQESLQELRGGATIRLDCPPGVGWVLEAPGYATTFWATEALARKAWVYRRDSLRKTA